jgi:hypothetical protein
MLPQAGGIAGIDKSRLLLCRPFLGSTNMSRMSERWRKLRNITASPGVM